MCPRSTMSSPRLAEAVAGTTRREEAGVQQRGRTGQKPLELTGVQFLNAQYYLPIF